MNMGLSDYFKPVPTWSVDEVKKCLEEKALGEYNLVDVRLPREYEEGHLPGARLIPIAELPNRLHELDPSKITITYCRSGNRSRSAAGILQSAGFKNAINMEGGIIAWRGLVAAGVPEAGMAHFSSAVSLEEMAGLAWMLEDGNRYFYSGVAENLSDAKARKLFIELVSAEERHKSELLRVYLEKTGKSEDRDFPSSVIHDAVNNDIMEGGISLSVALEWAKGKDIIALLEFSMSIETNSYDLYLKMMRNTGDGKYGNVFRVLSEEERDHLHRFSSLLEKQH